MSTATGPDAPAPLVYDLEERIVADTPQRMKALGEPVRMLVLDLVLAGCSRWPVSPRRKDPS